MEEPQSPRKDDHQEEIVWQARKVDPGTKEHQVVRDIMARTGKDPEEIEGIFLYYPEGFPECGRYQVFYTREDKATKEYKHTMIPAGLVEDLLMARGQGPIPKGGEG